jgi:hypothetical protein
LLVEKLGKERSSKIKFIGEAEVEGSLYGQLEFGQGTSASLDEQLAFAASRAGNVPSFLYLASIFQLNN